MTEITIEVDDARAIMYDELCKEFGEDEVQKTLKDQLDKHITIMYDNQERLKEKAEV